MRILLALFFFLSIAQLSGQIKNGNSINEIYQNGEQALLKGDAQKAIQHFQKALEIQPEFFAANRALGASYELIDEYDKAIKEYEKVIKRKPYFSRVLYYEIAQASFKIGAYEQALTYFMTFDSLQTIDINLFGLNGAKEHGYELDYLRKTPRNINACKVAIDQAKYTEVTIVENLGPQINSSSDEYFPYLVNNQKTLYYTSRINTFEDENLYRAVNTEEGWGSGRAVQEKFNTGNHEGMPTFTKDGYKMYFTACNRRNVMGNCDIQVAYLDADTISTMEVLKGYSNSGRWDSQASISCDGSTLYFASNREGGFGGTDIWYSHIEEDGSWSEAINAGNNINTKLDEEAPFISNDGNTLYFSSTGHLGLGEQDLFLSRLESDDSWSVPIHLGAPINTGHRELGFFLSADGKIGYFSSNRPQGYGGMDLYKFELPNHLNTNPITYVEGFVKDSITGEPVEVNIKVNKNRIVTTDSLGRFFLCYPANNNFDVEISKDKYHDYSKKSIIPKWDNKEFYALDFLLNPIKLELKTAIPKLQETAVQPIKEIVYFDFDQYDLSFRSKEILNRIISVSKSRTISRLLITGYCDKTGSDAYNFYLSMRRAQAVADFFSAKGLAPTQVNVEGRGEVDISTYDHLDRKVEIFVVFE